MEDFLFNIDVTPQMVYLAAILLVIGKGLKETPFIKNWSIVWILMAISIIVNFVFSGITLFVLFEAVIATSLATVIYQAYKQTNEGIRNSKKR